MKIGNYALYAIALVSLCGAAYAQPDPAEKADLIALHEPAIKRVKGMIADSSKLDVSGLEDSLKIAAFLHRRLSDDADVAPAPSQQAPCEGPPTCERRCVYQPEWYQTRRGRWCCRYVARWIWVKTADKPCAPSFAAPLGRRPLKESIGELEEFFRSRGNGPVNLKRDMDAAYQVLAILIILDPEFIPGAVAPKTVP